MIDNTIVVTVWGENWCDEDFEIHKIYGFSYYAVELMIADLKENFFDFLSNYREHELTLKPIYEKAQIGNYPPPNIEIEAYWDFEILEVKPFENEESEDKHETNIQQILESHYSKING